MRKKQEKNEANTKKEQGKNNKRPGQVVVM